MPVAHIYDPSRIEGDARVVERLAVAREAESRRTDNLTRMRAKRQKTPTPERQEMFSRRLDAFDVVHRHVIGRAVEDSFAEQNQRSGDIQLVDIVVVEREHAVQDAVDVGHSRAMKSFQFGRAQTADLLDQHGEAVRSRRPHHGVRELCEIGVPQVGNDQADDTRAPGAQPTR